MEVIHCTLKVPLTEINLRNKKRSLGRTQFNVRRDVVRRSQEEVPLRKCSKEVPLNMKNKSTP